MPHLKCFTSNICQTETPGKSVEHFVNIEAKRQNAIWACKSQYAVKISSAGLAQGSDSSRGTSVWLKDVNREVVLRGPPLLSAGRLSLSLVFTNEKWMPGDTGRLIIFPVHVQKERKVDSLSSATVIEELFKKLPANFFTSCWPKLGPISTLT